MRSCEEDDLQPNAQAVLLSVVIDDDADAVSTVQHSQPEQQQIPDLPEGVSPLAAHEAEVDGVDTVTDHEVGEQVTENQHDEYDAGQAHTQPSEHLKVVALGGGAVVLHTVDAGCHAERGT